ncbi:MAG: hypothetical protein JSS72_03665 [Armatimonadetes bacterium]|nr:hypothetical protein [Armatimonadota bacterium]
MLRFVSLFLLVGIAQSLVAYQAKPIPLSHILGSWEDVEGKVIRISKVDAKTIAVKGELGLEWRGTYENNKLRVTLKPPYTEMNPAIPEWARKQADGALVWKLNLDATEDQDGLKLTGSLLPGEVEWHEVMDPEGTESYKRSARVTGSTGTAIKLVYTKARVWQIVDTSVLEAKAAKSTTAGTEYEYALFVYGPSLPRTRKELKRLVIDTDGIQYQVLGATEDALSQHDAALRSQGWKEVKRGVSAHDANTIDKEWGCLLLNARVDPNVMPGYHKFRIGTASCGWFLDQGTAKAKLTTWREIDNSPGEPTTYAFIGEQFRAQLDVGPKFLNPTVTEIPLTIAVNGAFMLADGQLTARLDGAASTASSIYRSPEIELVGDTDPRLQPFSKIAMSGGKLLLAAEPGDNIQIGISDRKAFLCPDPVANVFVSADRDGPWIEALRRAAAADGLSTKIDLRASRGKTVEEVSNTLITQVAFYLRLQYLSPLVRFIQYCYGYTDAEMAHGDVIVRHRIKLGEHAAALLLRSEFVEQMQPIVDTLNAIKTDQDKLAYLDACSVDLLNPKSALFNVEFVDPESTSAVDSATVSPRSYELGNVYGFAATNPSRNRLLIAGFDAYRKMVLDAQKKAIAIPDNDIQGLFALTGDCFGPVIKTLIPKLMRPVVDSAGGITWQPDGIARKEVQNMATSWEAIKAQKELKSIDTEVVIAAATCALQGAGQFVKLAARIAAAANLASNVYSSYSSLANVSADSQKEMFAIGSSKILGSDRFEMVQQQKTPAWAVALNLLNLGISTKGDLATLMGRTPSGEAMGKAAALAQAVKSDGVAAITRMKPEERAKFLIAAAGVERKAAKTGVNGLTANEQEIYAGMKSLSSELEQKGAFKIDIEPGQETRAIRADAETVHVPKKELLPETPSPSPQPEQAPAAEPVEPTEPNTEYTYSVKYGDRRFLANVKELRQLKRLQREILPSGFPSGPGPWKCQGETFQLGTLLGEGEFMAVFDELNTPNAIKICKWIEGQLLGSIYEDMALAQKLLKDAQIPHLEVQIGPPPRAGESFWVRQPKMDSSMVIPRAGQLLSRPQRKAVMNLIEKLYDAKLVAEDLKTNNIFLKQLGNGDWVAGILDVDRVCKWGEFTPQINGALEIMEDGRKGLNCIMAEAPENLQNGKRLLRYDEFWKAQMEKGAWLRFGDNGDRQTFMNSVLDAEEVFSELKFMKGRNVKIELKGRLPYKAKPANSNQLADMWTNLGDRIMVKPVHSFAFAH